MMDVHIDRINEPPIEGPFVPDTDIEIYGPNYLTILKNTFILHRDNMRQGWVKVSVK